MPSWVGKAVAHRRDLQGMVGGAATLLGPLFAGVALCTWYTASR